MVWLILYAVLINLAALIVFGVDKKRARRHEWRISERTLFLLALAGGSVGAILGMLVFRHKTRHLKFRILVPLFLILHIALAVYMVKRGLLP